MTEKKSKNLLAIASIFLVCIICAQGLYMTGLIPGRNVCGTEALPPASEVLSEDVKTVQGSLSHEGYTLEKVIVLSRHNIRSPLSSGDSLLGRIREEYGID